MWDRSIWTLPAWAGIGLAACGLASSQSVRAALAGSPAVLAQSQGAQTDPDLPAVQAFGQSKRGQILLVDIRSPDEWAATGVPEGAMPITMHQPLEAFFEQMTGAVQGRKSVAIVLICSNGGRSKEMQTALQMDGFSHVGHVQEGLLGNDQMPSGWIAQGLPMRALGDAPR